MWIGITGCMIIERFWLQLHWHIVLLLVYYWSTVTGKLDNSGGTPSISNQAEKLVEKTKDELLIVFKDKLEKFQVRNAVQQCVIYNLETSVSLLRTENRHIKTLNGKLRGLVLASEKALENKEEDEDARVRTLRNLVTCWREEVETQVAVSNSNDALRRQAEIEALTYRLQLNDNWRWIKAREFEE